MPAASMRAAAMACPANGIHHLGAKIAEAGKGRRLTAGQQVRVVDIPGDANAGRGLFEELHGFDDAAALSGHLRAAAAQNYGHAGRELLSRIAADLRAAADELGRYKKQFLAENCPENSDGQIFRVANRFALVAAAGELATALGSFPWPAGEASRGVGRYFADWLKQRAAPARSRLSRLWRRCAGLSSSTAAPVSSGSTNPALEMCCIPGSGR